MKDAHPVAGTLRSKRKNNKKKPVQNAWTMNNPHISKITNIMISRQKGQFIQRFYKIK